jgi:hypothetical protein
MPHQQALFANLTDDLLGFRLATVEKDPVAGGIRRQIFVGWGFGVQKAGPVSRIACTAEGIELDLVLVDITAINVAVNGVGLDADDPAQVLLDILPDVKARGWFQQLPTSGTEAICAGYTCVITFRAGHRSLLRE